MGKKYGIAQYGRNGCSYCMLGYQIFIISIQGQPIEPCYKTLTGIPNFPSYISGHSTFSGAAATILGHIIPERASAYDAMAEEAARSRIVWRTFIIESDCGVGLAVGKNVGNYAVQRAQTDGAE